MIARRIEVLFVLTLSAAFSLAYVVPKARIDVLHPKGFSVSIPDTPGIQLFAFHGNLNSPMEGLENGQFSADILKHKNGRWTFTNRKHEIKPGDVLYYWLYVQKESLGYRRDDQKHEFTEADVYGGSNSTYEEPSTEYTSPDYTERPSSRPTQPPRGNTHGSSFGGSTLGQGGNSFGQGGNSFGQGGTNSGGPYGGGERGTSVNENCSASTGPMRVFPSEVHHYHHHFLPTLAPSSCPPYGGGNQHGGFGGGGSNFGGNNNFGNNEGGSSGFPNPEGGQGGGAQSASIQQLTNQMRQVMAALENMKLKVATLSEVVDELINSNTNTKLLLTGAKVDATTNLFDLVRHIILDRLDLKDLKNDIYSATRTKKGIVFDVASGLDKRRILARSRERLRGDDEELRISDYYDAESSKNNSNSNDDDDDGSPESIIDTRFGDE